MKMNMSKRRHLGYELKVTQFLDDLEFLKGFLMKSNDRCLIENIIIIDVLDKMCQHTMNCEFLFILPRLTILPLVEVLNLNENQIEWIEQKKTKFHLYEMNHPSCVQISLKSLRNSMHDLNEANFPLKQR